MRQAAAQRSDQGETEVLTIDSKMQSISTDKAAEGPPGLSSCSMSAQHTSDSSGLQH